MRGAGRLPRTRPSVRALGWAGGSPGALISRGYITFMGMLRRCSQSPICIPLINEHLETNKKRRYIDGALWWKMSGVLPPAIDSCIYPLFFPSLITKREAEVKARLPSPGFALYFSLIPSIFVQAVMGGRRMSCWWLTEMDKSGVIRIAFCHRGNWKWGESEFLLIVFSG